MIICTLSRDAHYPSLTRSLITLLDNSIWLYQSSFVSTLVFDIVKRISHFYWSSCTTYLIRILSLDVQSYHVRCYHPSSWCLDASFRYNLLLIIPTSIGCNYPSDTSQDESFKTIRYNSLLIIPLVDYQPKIAETNNTFWRMISTIKIDHKLMKFSF